MEVTLLGMVMEVRLLHPWKAPCPMEVTLLGIIVFLQPDFNVFDAVSIIALQLSRESYFVLPLSTLMEVRPLQPAKAYSPMEITLLGMVMEVRPLQFSKARQSMEVTLFGIVMEVRLLHPRKASVPMEITLLGMVMEVRLLHPWKAVSAIPTVPSFIDIVVLADIFPL